MIPKLAIEKAIGGGWTPRDGKDKFEWALGGYVFYQTRGGHETFLVCEEIALMPLFWQALGKALGWAETITNTDVCTDCLDKYKPVGWHRNALRFYDLILTGGDTKTFWDELLTPIEE